MRRALTVLALASVLANPASGLAQSPAQLSPRQLCVNVMAPAGPLDAGAFLKGVADGTIVVQAVGDCGNQTATPVASHPITGTFTFPYRFSDVGTYCQGLHDNADIRPGLPVTVADQAGAVVGVSSLGSGVVVLDAEKSMMCVFPFDVDVTEAPFYQISIGSRQGPIYSLADMQSMNWSVAFTP